MQHRQTTPRFVDTNAFLRYLLNDDPVKAQSALALLQRAERGEERMAVSSLVIFEIIFTLQKSHHVPRGQIREAMRYVLSLRGLELPNKRLYEHALDLYASQSISFADAYNAAYMQSRGLSEIYTWDTDFDKLAGITRVEPQAD